MKPHKALPNLVIAACLVVILVVSCVVYNSEVSKPQTSSKALVTFIIPTIGRPTLKRTIRSLEEQGNPNWKAIVVFDGVPSQRITTDPRIKVMTVPKTGKYNHAGEVRNQGMQYVESEWIAFVDDDDYLSPDYVDRLVEELMLCPSVETVIFRMWHAGQQRILPLPSHTNFWECYVGISFAIKASLYKAGFRFTPGPTEDFRLLDAIRKAGHKMVLSPYVTYWIREPGPRQVAIDQHTHTRAYIN